MSNPNYNGVKAIEDMLAKRAARKQKKVKNASGAPMESLSDSGKATKKQMLTTFHAPVARRDKGLCQYCLCLENGKEEPANRGDHIKTQGARPDLREEPWNGINACWPHNQARNAFGAARIHAEVEERSGHHIQRMSRNGVVWERAVYDHGRTAGGWTRIV